MNKLRLTDKCREHLPDDLIELLEQPILAKLLQEFDARITKIEHASIRYEDKANDQGRADA
jgi:hypothetical protein